MVRCWAESLLDKVPESVSQTISVGDGPLQIVLTGDGQGRPVLDSSRLSAIEIGYPQAVSYLMTTWGDVEAFQQVFRQLILGDCGGTGSWTPEAWAELQFLQDLHDRAYGLSEARRSTLKPGPNVRVADQEAALHSRWTTASAGFATS